MARPPSRRTITQLTGTHRRLDAHLCLPSFTALHLAVAHLSRAHTLRPTLSAVLRAAVIDYTQRIEKLTGPEKEREARRTASLSKAFKPDAEAVIQAEKALKATSEGLPPPNLQDALVGPSGRIDPAALEATVNRHLKAMFPRKYKDLP